MCEREREREREWIECIECPLHVDVYMYDILRYTLGACETLRSDGVCHISGSSRF